MGCLYLVSGIDGVTDNSADREGLSVSL